MSVAACLTHPLIIRVNPKDRQQSLPLQTSLTLDPVCAHWLTQGTQGMLKTLTVTHPRCPTGPEGTPCTLLEFALLPTRPLTSLFAHGAASMNKIESP